MTDNVRMNECEMAYVNGYTKGYELGRIHGIAETKKAGKWTKTGKKDDDGEILYCCPFCEQNSFRRRTLNLLSFRFCPTCGAYLGEV